MTSHLTPCVVGLECLGWETEEGGNGRKKFGLGDRIRGVTGVKLTPTLCIHVHCFCFVFVLFSLLFADVDVCGCLSFDHST